MKWFLTNVVQLFQAINENVKVKIMQRPGTEAIRTQIQPSNPKREIIKITNSQNTKRTYGQPSKQLFHKSWSFSNPNRTKNNMSRVMRKPAFCICENKDADQLRGNREADQRLCFRYTDSTISLLPKSEISSL